MSSVPGVAADAGPAMASGAASAAVAVRRPAALARLELLSDAIATIMARGIAQGDAPVVAALVRGLHRYWLLSGRMQEAVRVVAAACAVPGHQPSDQVQLELLAGVWRSYLATPRRSTCSTGRSRVQWSSLSRRIGPS